jgi:homogentisate 1,2-dioxygenase
MNQGFGNYFTSEAVPGALPQHQNSPQKLNLHLYAEQISGSAFTRLRHQNFKSWVYRLKPSVSHTQIFTQAAFNWLQPIIKPMAPNPLRWSPPTSPTKSCDFMNGLFHIASSGDLNHVYWYDFNESMTNCYFSNYDGELLFIPYHGSIQIMTEFGELSASPEQIIVIPRGIHFQIINPTHSKGYLAENGGTPFKLPELGTIGANGLAHPRHFNYPNACFEDKQGNFIQYTKFQGQLWQKTIEHSPLNVVAWHGNYLPYHYDLKLFNSINSVSYDHIDPSIYTVLTSESEIPGVANLDFVIFPRRWSVAEHSFRLPYFHRNIMSELMGLINGQYDAKGKDFSAGGVSIHNQMTPHGPDFQSWKQEIDAVHEPNLLDNTLAFMLESNQIWQVTEQAMILNQLQQDYSKCWQDFPSGKI